MMDESSIGSLESRARRLHALNAKLPTWEYTGSLGRCLEEIAWAQWYLNNAIYAQMQERPE